MLYLTADHFSFFLPLGLIGVFRYLWFIIRLLAAWAYTPIPVPKHPTYFAHEDVTIVVPTIDSDDHFLSAMRSWLVGEPFEIIIITATHVLPALQGLADQMNAEDAARHPGQAMGRDGKGRIRVFGVEKANKRKQMVEGIKRTETDIIVFADDDAIWPPTMLPLILACFEDLSIGGVGTSQVVTPLDQSGSKRFTVWETLAAFRLTIRNIEIASAAHLDGGVPCLSGRTAAYRSIMLKDPEFMYQFTNDYWRGKYHLNSGDDKFLTRWCVSHGWKTWVQVCKGAELQSTMKADWTFLKQVLRWTRNTWRSDLRSIFIERHIWTRHPYVAYTMIDKFLNPFTLLAGPALVMYLCARSAEGERVDGSYVLPVWNILISWFLWLTATRTAKLAPHLWKRPRDFIYVPVWVLFGYYFSVMKLYALCTLHEVGWGTRAGIDTSPSPSSNDDHTRPFVSPQFDDEKRSSLATRVASPSSVYPHSTPSSPPRGAYPHPHGHGYSDLLPAVAPPHHEEGPAAQQAEVAGAGRTDEWAEWEQRTKEALERYEQEEQGETVFAGDAATAAAAQELQYDGVHPEEEMQTIRAV
ncbi:hypothetical protein JCM1840_003114 [Sporobolomyces johnsonii]